MGVIGGLFFLSKKKKSLPNRFYWAKMYTADFKNGESYGSLHKCITINIIADGFRLNDAIHSEYVLQEKTTHTVLTDVLEIHFLDLQAAKRVKEEKKPKSLINWLRFIGTSNKEERAMLARTSPVLQILNEQIDILSLSPIERKLYESRMKLKSDITTISENQFKAGWQEGKLEGKLETARILKQLGDPIQKIIQVTGLSQAEIEALN